MDSKSTKTRRRAVATGQPASLADDILGEPRVTALRYHRLSDDKGADAKQEGRTRRLCERAGATILATFSDDDTTAWYDPVVDDEPEPRPGFEDLLEAIAKLRPTYVVCLRPSRLTRNVDDFARLRRVAARARVTVITERKRFDMTDPADRSSLMRACDDDESYVSSISEGLASALADRRDEGKPRFGGVRPYGFEPDRVTPKPDEAKAIRWLAERVLAGDSLAGMANELNERGLPAPAVATANRARLDKRKRSLDGVRWGSSTIKSLLRRPSTAGLLSHNGDVRGQFAAVAAGEVEPILDAETWERVNAKLDVASKARFGGKRSPEYGTYYLAGLLVCGACGARMHGGRMYVDSKRTLGRMYRCEHSCLAVRADDWDWRDETLHGIENVVRGIVLDLGSDPRHMHAIAEAAEARSSEWHALHERKTALQNERHEWQTATDEHGERLPYAEVADRLAAIRQDLAKVERAMRELDPTPADALDRMRAQARGRLERAWELADNARRRAMVASIVGGVRIKPAGRGKRTPPAERVELIEH